ncbi:MAG: SusD/RagB family nutrient-binding outer membrane lipoprotein, partial [Pseudomonadota bacterium]|nr:SusD/RagB family nutrient-binding outer membrane lipoprotein [Pseudomonadota bacterium]
MKNFKIVFSLLIVFVISCEVINESYTDGYSENPNNPTDAPLENLFTAAQAGMIVFMESHPARLSNLWTQHATGESRQYAGYYGYSIDVSELSFGYSWNNAYVDVLANIKQVQEKAVEEGGRENILAVSKIIEAITIGTVTALWGDVPYTEAFDVDDIENPKYDSQIEVYGLAQDLLDEAVETLENDPRNLLDGLDILSYNGDVEKWIKAAYSFKARFYMETGQIQEAISAAENGIMDPADDLYINHFGTNGRDMNLWYSFMEFDRNGLIGASDNHAFPLMNDRENSKTDEEGRMSYYYSEDGLALNILPGNAFGPSANYPIFNANETFLILAEAYAINANDNTTRNIALSYLNDARQYNENKFTGSTYQPLVLSDFETGGEYE